MRAPEIVTALLCDPLTSNPWGVLAARSLCDARRILLKDVDRRCNFTVRVKEVMGTSSYPKMATGQIKVSPWYYSFFGCYYSSCGKRS